MDFFRILLCAIIGLVLSPCVFAQQSTTPATTTPASTNTAANNTSANAAGATRESAVRRVGEPVTVVFWNRPITIFRSYYDAVSPAERAARTVERLRALPEVAPEWKIAATEATSGQYTGVIISVNDQFALGILNDDLDVESGETLKSATDRATAQLRAALEARAQQRSLPTLLRGIGFSIAASLVLLFLLWLLMRAGHRVLARMDQTAGVSARPVKLAGLDLQPLVHSLNRGLTRLTTWAFAVVLIYIWLTFVLLRFPYSQPWGQQLGSFLIDLFGRLGAGLLHSIPGMFTVVVIFLLARIVTRLVGGFFREVEKGGLTLSWLHRDTAGATRHLVTAMIWIFGITVAYPYFPGSSTEAFKGVSVLVGLMLSLGSAGLINQVMSGLVVVYSRALKRGEVVSVGDDRGVVTDVGMLSTKILTHKREEITIPNAVLVGAKVVNYSRQEGGASVGITLTIGYDAPWRLVHAMLLQAANETAGLRKEPAPRVWQKALSDFYVEYELMVSLERQEGRVAVLSELHTHIQDAFNEQGVQIMSPHFESQPGEKVFVPKAQWFPKDNSSQEK